MPSEKPMHASTFAIALHTSPDQTQNIAFVLESDPVINIAVIPFESIPKVLADIENIRKVIEVQRTATQANPGGIQ